MTKRLRRNHSPAFKAKVALAAIKGEKTLDFIRLMYIGQLKNLCEFENPSTEMRNDAALDYGLRDMGLVKIENNAVTRDSVRAELAIQSKGGSGD
jgi:hypothetical protein